jgi:multiple sugar transport system ATP-binding protein
MARITLDQVNKEYKNITVIQGLSLTIHDGEFFTFVGPSGCGKSTLLNMIAGLVPVSKGRILFDEVPVNEFSPKDRDVAMVFQSSALYPHMSVYKNIAFPLKMKKVAEEEIDREVRRVAVLLGLEDLLQRKPKQLSGGQRQRVALGRAIIRRPKVFLMDEPLSNLDARLRIEMRAEIKKLHQDLGITTVYVTHDQAEALSLSDRIAVINEGKIEQCGTPREVYLKPANTFVAGFIGSPPMNVLPATIRNVRPLEVSCLGTIFRPSSAVLSENMELIAGIRPEDIVVSSEALDASVKVKVTLVEPAGSFQWIDVRWEDEDIKGTADIDSDLRPGDSAYMTFPAERSVIFDRKTGKKL